jgi:hypothetical protein
MAFGKGRTPEGIFLSITHGFFTASVSLFARSGTLFLAGVLG